MKRSTDHYITQVLEKVKFKEAHVDIARELQSHLDDLRETLSKVNPDQTKLEKDILTCMGSPDEVGIQFNSIHQPRTDWFLILSVMTLLLSGLATMWSLGFLMKQLLWSVIGIVLAIAITLNKPTSFFRISTPAFLALLFVTMLSFFYATYEQGQPYLSFGGLNIKIMELSSALFVVTAPSIITRIRNRIWDQIWLFFLVTPTWMLIKTGSIFPFLAYGNSILAMMLIGGARFSSVIIFVLLSSIGMYFKPVSEMLLSHSAHSDWSKLSHTDFVLLAQNSLSPFYALTVGIISILVSFRFFSVAKEIRNLGGKMTVTGIATYISFGVLWNLFSNLGYAPMPRSGINLPFVSYGGSMMVAHSIMVGLALSYYRRKSIMTAL